MPEYKPYNPNTKYGRRKAREQARKNYENGTPEYRESIDEIGCVVWAVIIAVIIIIFFLIAYFKGADAAVDWAK